MQLIYLRKRKQMEPAAYMPKPLNEATIDFNSAVNEDIRTQLERNFLKGVPQCANLAKVFKGKTPVHTAKRLHWYLRNRCQYRRDPDENQIIRLPSYFVNHKGIGDCKTFALFARCVYAALYPELATAFRFTNYRGGDIPSHVYTVVKDEKGNDIIIDGCWYRFNSEKKYRFALPLNFKRMKVTTLSGIGGLGFVPKQNFGKGQKITTKSQRMELLKRMNKNLPYAQRKRLVDLNRLCKMKNLNNVRLQAGEISPATHKINLGIIRGELKRVQGVHSINGKKKKKKGKAGARLREVKAEMARIKKLPKNQRKAARKALRKKVGGMIKGDLKKGFTAIARGFNTVALAPVTGAFLAIVALNLNGLASNLQILHDYYTSGKDKTGWTKVMKIWQNMGGIKKALEKVVAKGAKRKKLFLSKKAKARYARNHKGISGFNINDCVVLEGRNAIGHPAVVAAAVAAASGLIAAMIPVIMQALKKNGATGAAQEVAQQGEDIVEQTKNGEGYQQTFQGANEGVDPNAAPQQVEPNEGGEGEEETESEGDAPEETETGTEIEEVVNSCHDGGGIHGGMDAETTASLIKNLGNVASAAIDFTTTVVKKKAKKNPQLAKVLNTGAQTASAIVANQYSKGMGVTKKPFTVRKKSATEKLLTPVNIGIGLAVLVGGAVALKKL